MRDRWAEIYEDLDRPFGLGRLEAELAPAGLTLERPGRQAAVAIVGPEYYTEVPRDSLCAAGELATDISFDLWWSGDLQTYCRVHLIDRTRHISVDLSPASWDPKHQKALGKALAAMAAARIRDGTLVGYVYDPEAMAEAADWDELYLGGRLPDRFGRLGEGWFWPRVVLARRHLVPVFEGMKVVRQRGGMVAVGPDARRWRRGRS